MNATDLVEPDATAPPSGSSEPSEHERATDEIARLEERRRDAYRVG